MIGNKHIAFVMNERFGGDGGIPHVRPWDVDQQVNDAYGYTFMILCEAYPPIVSYIDAAFVVEFPEMCGMVMMSINDMPFMLIERMN